jgi:cobalamin biosynthetic protein CobC
MLEHGGRLRQAALDYGIPLADWLDLSAAINPAPWPAPPLPDTIWQRLPDNDAAVQAAAKNYYGSNDMLATAGSQSAIGWLPQLRPRCRVVVFEPGYMEHTASWRGSGHDVSAHTLAERPAYLSRMAEGGEPAPDVIVIINPHNPTGDTLQRDLLLRVHARLADKGGWLVVDEAFADGGAASSCIQEQMPTGLIVLRSLGKFFGLPGLRSGFAFAAPELLAALSERAGPWPLTTAAQYLLPQALADHDWQAAAAINLAQSSARLREQLQALPLPLLTGTSLFQSISCHTPAKAGKLQQQFATRGILVRHYSDSGLLRFGLPATTAQWQRLAEAIADLSRGSAAQALTQINRATPSWDTLNRHA